MNENNKNRNYFIWAVAASVMLHVLFSFSKIDRTPIKIKNEDKEISQFKVKVLKRIVKQRAKTKKQKQIVASQQVKKAKKPVDTRFLGKQTQVVDRETVSKRVGSFNLSGKGIKTGVKNAQVAKVSGKKKQSKRNHSKKLKLTDLGSLSAGQFKKPVPEENKARLGVKDGDIKQKGLAQNNDFVDDVKLGDMTNLNTVEFKYYGFYNRIKQQLEQFWGASLRTKAKRLMGQGRRLASNENYITSLIITLDKKGNIVHVKVASTSGMKDLDDAAIESFNKAGPFPNPPKGMVKNGQATIRWGFVVKS